MFGELKKRKRAEKVKGYLAAYLRGEAWDDEPTTEEAGSKRRRTEGGAAVAPSGKIARLELPTYEGRTNEELQNFLHLVNARRGYSGFAGITTEDHIIGAASKFTS